MVAIQNHNQTCIITQIRKQEIKLNVLYTSLTNAMINGRLSRQKILSYDISNTTYDISKLRNNEIIQNIR